jgi:hypothetical protein
MAATNVWMLEELQRIAIAERVAEAQAVHMAKAARKANGTHRPLRVALADALRTVAAYLDRDGAAVSPTNRRLARVF